MSILQTSNRAREAARRSPGPRGVPTAVLPGAEENARPGFLALVSGVYLGSVACLSAAGAQYSWLPQLIGLGVGLCWLVFSVLSRRKLIWPKPVIIYVLWALWASVGFTITAFPSLFIIQWTTLIKVVAMTFVISQCVRTGADLRACFVIIGLSTVIIFVQGVDDIMRAVRYSGTLHGTAGRTATELVQNANTLALYGVLVLVGSTCCFLTFRSAFFKVLVVAFVPIALYIIAATGSRKGLLGVILAGLGVFHFHFRKVGISGSAKRVAMILLGMLLAAGCVVFVTKAPFFFRLLDTFSDTQAVRTDPRFVLLLAGLQATLEHPVFGMGLEGFSGAAFGGADVGYSHSTVTETLAATGIPGFLLYYASLLSLYSLIRRLRRAPLPPRDAAMVNVIMVIFLVIFLFTLAAVMFSDRLFWPVLGAICGYLAHLKARHLDAPQAAKPPRAPTPARLRPRWNRPLLPR